MNFWSAVLWGFVGTIVLTTIMSASQGLRLTRMSLPFLLGTIVTPNRDRAMLVGTLIHLVDGWLFAFLYVAAFESWHRANWVLGGGIGLVHAVAVLTVAMPLIPAIHPRMVSPYFGPTPNRQLQPPGFLALHYGRRTPLVTLLAHVAYGVILGSFYHLAVP
jgi:hypothetical protein